MNTNKIRYGVCRLDGRHSYNHQFRYYLDFSGETMMISGQAAAEFNKAMQWCIRTWGWSAEINQAAKIRSWTETMHNLRAAVPQLAGGILDIPDCCNQLWSWSNAVSRDLRIYLQGDAELAFFQLAHPIDR